MFGRFFGAVFLILGFVQPLPAEPLLTGRSAGMEFQVDQVAAGLGVPWGMVLVAPEKLLVTERQGRARLLDLTDGSTTLLRGIPKIRARGQGGLLDVALPPDYRPGGWIYFTYSKDQSRQQVTALARARLSGTRLEEWQDLLVTRSTSDSGRHFGSRIAFDGAGHLFFTIGDRGDRPNGQDLTTHAGSVLRVNLDGSAPADNPFVNQSGARPEIWSYGHRNPQGIVYDADNRRLWVIEHGPRGGDEINLVESGRNYGWPVISYGKEYWGPVAVGEGTEKPGMEQPVKVYIPSIAPGSLLLYSGTAFPGWRGNLFSGALKLTHLNRVVLDEQGKAISEERLLESMGERIRALLESPEGWIYFSTDSGRILRLRPTE